MMLKRLLTSLESTSSYIILGNNFSVRLSRYISCWRCGREESSAVQCQVCHATFDQTKINYFELFGLPVNYYVNTTDVVVSYHKLQKQFHPDKHSNDSEEIQDTSKEFSSLVNKAYKILLSPIDRGVYMLTLHNVPLEMTTASDPELLSDVLEIDCDIAKCTKQSGIKIKKKLTIELDKLNEELSEAFKEKRYDRAQKLLIKMRYLQNLMNKLKAKLLKF